MAHLRQRTITEKLLKRLRFFPVVAIQGARQTGKSVLAKQILASELSDSHYVTFDNLDLRTGAQSQPQTFLTGHADAHPLILDEAQKVPEIFDAIKARVDDERRPGQFLILGSTEFSRLTRIREALTGRMGRVRLYPLTLREACDLPPKRNISRMNVLQYLKAGGMPGIFAVRDEEARSALFQDWIDLTCSRDILQFRTLKLDPDLCYRILRAAATLAEPTQAQVARALNRNTRSVGTHLKALCELFVLQKLEPHPSGSGKPIFLLLDVGIARYLGAPEDRLLHILLVNERMAANSYSGEKRKSFFYYRSTGKRLIHLVEDSIDHGIHAFELKTAERILKIDAELMRAFRVKNPKARGTVLAPVHEKISVNGIDFQPWELMADLR